MDVRAWLIVLAATRGVFFGVEQPLHSHFFKVDHVRSALDITGAQRLVTMLGAFGAGSLKPLEIWTTMPAVMTQRLVRTAKQSRVRMNRIEKHQLVIEQAGSRKRKWVTGNKDALKKSQAYPVEFCESFASGMQDYPPPNQQEIILFEGNFNFLQECYGFGISSKLPIDVNKRLFKILAKCNKKVFGGQLDFLKKLSS